MAPRNLKLTRIIVWYLVSGFISTVVSNISEFEGKIITNDSISIIEFTCKTYQRPIGDSLIFLLNEKTTDVMRLLDGKCFHNYGECTKCHCFLSQNKITFTWMYNMNVPCHNCTFGADMSFANEDNGKTINVNLYRRFNGTGLGPLQFDSEEVLNTIQEDGYEDFISFPYFFCLLITVTGILMTILVLLRYCRLKKARSQRNRRNRMADNRNGVDQELQHMSDPDPRTTPSSTLNMLKKPGMSMKCLRKINLKNKPMNISGLVSIKSQLVVADNYENTLEIYYNDQHQCSRKLEYRINGVTCLPADCIAVTLVNRDNIYIYQLENNDCTYVKTIHVSSNIFGITSDKNHLIFEQRDEQTKTSILKLCDTESTEECKVIMHKIDLTYSHGIPKKLDMTSKKVYICNTNTDQVCALNLNGQQDWNMPIPKLAEIVLVQNADKNPTIFVWSESQKEIYCVSKGESRLVEEEGETMKNSSIFKFMTYNKELNQIFVQTDSKVISVYDIIY